MTMMKQQTEGIGSSLTTLETSHAKLTQMAWLMVVTITDHPFTRKMIASHTSISQHTVRNMQRVKAILLQQSPGRDLSTVSWQSVKHLAKWEVKVDEDGRVSLVPSKRWEKDRRFPSAARERPRFKRRMD